MTREDIIRMAREANILEHMGYENPDMKAWRDDVVRELERFAQLVAAAEREACAKVCSDMHLEGDDDTGFAAEAIRARKDL